MTLYTIGVYGKTEEQFFGQLTDAGIQLFVDVRLRRGMRGSKYSFANSNRLQQRLSELDIAYLHAKELAPPKEMRQIQTDADKQQRILKSERSLLSSQFVDRYRQEILLDDAVTALYEEIKEHDNACLFCVESEANACHRSLIAEKFAEKFGVEVKDI